jgi:uncharacterized phage-associated protein
MPFNAKAVANEFLRLAESEKRPLTPMALIKLVYFAHGWYLALKGEPLLNEQVEAWKYGPVIPSLYHEFKEFGNEAITRLAHDERTFRENGKFIIGRTTPELEDDDAKKVVRRVWDVYKPLSAVQLSNLTHTPGSPWDTTPNKEIKGTDISNETIRQYFLVLARQNAARRHQNEQQPA